MSFLMSQQPNWHFGECWSLSCWCWGLHSGPGTGIWWFHFSIIQHKSEGLINSYFGRLQKIAKNIWINWSLMLTWAQLLFSLIWRLKVHLYTYFWRLGTIAAAAAVACLLADTEGQLSTHWSTGQYWLWPKCLILTYLGLVWIMNPSSGCFLWKC